MRGEVESFQLAYGPWAVILAVIVRVETRAKERQGMESSSEVSTSGFPLILLEIVPDDPQVPDPVAIQEVSRQVIQDLKQDGDSVTPVYTGQRGGIDALFQVAISGAQTLGTDIMAHKDVFDVVVSICAILTSVRSLVTHLWHPGGKVERQPHHDVKVTVTIDQGTIELTSSDLADDERVKQLADHFLQLYPATKVTPHSQVKVKGRVSPRKRR